MRTSFGFLQMRVIPASPQGNMERVEELIYRAYEAGCLPNYLVLPELWNVGYPIEGAAELASPEGDRERAFLEEISRRFGVRFVGGSVLARTERGLVNRALVVFPEGSVGHYDKVHLFGPMGEDEYLVPGRRLVIFEAGGFRAGVLTCYDLRFPEAARALALAGAKALFVGAAWPSARVEHWRLLLRARAVEDQLFVVGCNACGESAGTSFGGFSAIVGPRGEEILESPDGEGVFCREVDLKEVDEARGAIPVLRDRRDEVYREVFLLDKPPLTGERGGAIL